MHPLIKLRDNQKNGIKRGIYSICSANEYVIEAGMQNAKKLGNHVLVEATANQVNQYGGYTGMLPADFREFVASIAKRVGFNENKIILGGDHLGPLTWKNESSQTAMKKAEELVKQFVLAGFTKIHIDTSMRLKDDDKSKRLSDKTIAERGVRLVASSEKAFAELQKIDPSAMHPVYVVGSEVPIPGGAQEEEEGVQVTKVSDFKKTVRVFNKEFASNGLSNIWNKVIGVVVQPGVEFSDESVFEYDRQVAKELVSALNEYPNLVFEGHSTDYQTKYKLKEMVEDGIAILKVGPALTFALREALFALCLIEEELLKGSGVYLSDFNHVIETQMLRNPRDWQDYYHARGDRLKLKRRFSLSDRSRYYLPVSEVNESIIRLITNLENETIPLTLLSQYMPIQYKKVRNGEIENKVKYLIIDRIINYLDEYEYAIKG